MEERNDLFDKKKQEKCQRSLMLTLHLMILRANFKIMVSQMTRECKRMKCDLHAGDIKGPPGGRFRLSWQTAGFEFRFCQEG